MATLHIDDDNNKIVSPLLCSASPPHPIPSLYPKALKVDSDSGVIMASAGDMSSATAFCVTRQNEYLLLYESAGHDKKKLKSMVIRVLSQGEPHFVFINEVKEFSLDRSCEWCGSFQSNLLHESSLPLPVSSSLFFPTFFQSVPSWFFICTFYLLTSTCLFQFLHSVPNSLHIPSDRYTPHI